MPAAHSTEPLIEILMDVGTMLLRLRKEGPINGIWEGTQLKTTADTKAHEMLLKSLSKLDRTVPILSEEGDLNDFNQRPERYFLIDPIDGTASYAGGFSGFVTQVAYIESGQVERAAVHAPELNLTWHAARGNGAFLGSQELQPLDSLDRLFVIDNYPSPRGIAAQLYTELPATGYVESGSLGLKICRIADGTADLFVKDVIVRDWDIAPGELILEEAGGWLSDMNGHAIQYDGSPEKKGIVAAMDHTVSAKALALIKSSFCGQR